MKLLFLYFKKNDNKKMKKKSSFFRFFWGKRVRHFASTCLIEDRLLMRECTLRVPKPCDVFGNTMLNFQIIRVMKENK